MKRTRSLVALMLLASALSHGGCISSSYQPVSRGTAKLTYKGSAPTVIVNEASASVSPFDSDYVDLFEDEPRELADSSHSQRIAGFTLGLVGTAGIIASFLIPERVSDLYEADTARGQVGLGVLLGAIVVGALGGFFDTSANVKLNDAINMHNDRYLAGLANAQSAGAIEMPAPLPTPSPAPAQAPAPTQAPAPATEAAPQPAPAAPQEAPAPATP